MRKVFTNSLGQRCIFNDDGIDFEARGVFCPYDRIESISLGLMGVFSVHCNGLSYTFVIDSEDKAEMKELVKEIKGKKVSNKDTKSTDALSKESIKNIKSSLFSDVLAELFVCLPVVGLVALVLFVLLPSLNGTLETVVIVAFVIVMLFAILLMAISLSSSIKKTVPQGMKKAKVFYNTLQVLVVVFCITASVGLFVLNYQQNFVGYKSGDYSNQLCYDCEQPADGGCWKSKYSPTEYYCQKHFDARKEALDAYKNSRYGEDSFGHDEADAWIAARDIVESQLKSPSTAEFCRFDEATIKRRGNTWTITGYVDAQNSFGATLRNDFTIEITFKNSVEYTIDKCDISAR